MHSSRFLHPQGLYHLEHIHDSLRLASLNSSGYGTEHATAAHCVTAGEISKNSHTITQNYTHTQTHTHTHIHTQPHSHKLLHITHPYKSTPTPSRTYTHTHLHPHTYTPVPMCTHAYRCTHISPAVHHNGVVAGTPLDFAHLLNHISHGLQVGAAAIRGPIGDVELAHLLCLTRLQGMTGHLSQALSPATLWD